MAKADEDVLYRPDLWMLDPAVTHLNHGSFGAVPSPVYAAQERWRLRAEANPVRFNQRELQPALDGARLVIAAFLGADPDGVALITNVTTASAVVFGAFPLAAGDEILTTDHGYGTVVLGAQKAARRVGARVVQAAVALDADDDAVLAAVLAATGPATRLAVIDQVSSPTAKRFPVERIVPALQERGVAVFLDGAHAPGMLPVDLGSLAPDFWAGNFHKWPCAPRGSGALYVAPRWRALVGAVALSWRDSEGFPHAFTNPGTTDQSAWLAMPAALEMFEGFGWTAVRARNAALAGYGQRVVAEALGTDLRAMPGDGSLPMRVVEVPGVADWDTAAALRIRLADKDGIETAVNVWAGRALLRVSGQLYVAEADFERLAAALPRAVEEALAGAR
jgi:isopenicillin-N epimerase